MHPKEVIEAQLQQFIRQHFPVARQHQVGLNDSLFELGIVDSLGVLEIVTFIEKDLGVQLTDDELVPEHFASIATIANLVAKRLDPEGAV